MARTIELGLWDPPFAQGATSLQAPPLRLPTEDVREATFPAATFTKLEHPGFEYCSSCDALLTDRGAPVGRHLFDCPKRDVPTGTPAWEKKIDAIYASGDLRNVNLPSRDVHEGRCVDCGRPVDEDKGRCLLCIGQGLGLLDAEGRPTQLGRELAPEAAAAVTLAQAKTFAINGAGELAAELKQNPFLPLERDELLEVVARLVRSQGDDEGLFREEATATGLADAIRLLKADASQVRTSPQLLVSERTEALPEPDSARTHNDVYQDPFTLDFKQRVTLDVEPATRTVELINNGLDSAIAVGASLRGSRLVIVCSPRFAPAPSAGGMLAGLIGFALGAMAHELVGPLKFPSFPIRDPLAQAIDVECTKEEYLAWCAAERPQPAATWLELRRRDRAGKVVKA